VFPQDPAILLLGTCPREINTNATKSLYGKLFTTAVFTIAKNENKCSSVDDEL
jgi:hypothetical protein